MGRLAPAAVVAALALRAAPAAAEPLDVSLVRLGPPTAAVWQALGADAASSSVLAADAERRFVILSNEVALAMSSPLLAPGATTGHSGFDLAAEASVSAVHDGVVGATAFGFSDRPWATLTKKPSSLLTSGVHVRKAFPFSVEVGGRLTSLLQTSYLAAQGEVKVALNEGFEDLPDVAVRLAYTRLFGQREWNLAATDLGLLVSKRWGVSGVTSLTPYLAARFTFVNASSERLVFGAPAGQDPAQLEAVTAAFPAIRSTLYRTTAGLRVTSDATSLALEATWFPGAKLRASDAYPEVKLASTFSAALKLGWEF